MHRRHLRAVAIAAAAVAWAATTVPLPASAAAVNLAVVGDVRVLPKDTAGLPALLPDGPAGVGYLLSGRRYGWWDRVQAVGLATGRASSPVVDIPPLTARAPVVVDTRRHLLIYAEDQTTLPSSETRVPAVPNLVGIGLRGGAVRVLFKVPTRFAAGERLAALTLDDSGDDLVALGVRDPESTQNVTPGASAIVRVDRLSVDALMRTAAGARWTEPYQLPAGRCAAMIDQAQPAALLMVGDRLHFGCGSMDPHSADSDRASLVAPAGIVRLSGVTRDRAPVIAPTFFPAPGQFVDGVAVADRVTRRFVLVSSLTGGFLMRVFDTDHGRYVGTVKADGNPFGFTTNPRTGRLYFAGGGGGASFGRADLSPLVPTQGETQNDPFEGMLRSGGGPRRLTFDGTGQRLYLPRVDSSNGPGVYTVVVVRDSLPRHVEPSVPDPDAGSLDTVDRPGVTDSNRSASARAFGADYQAVGGTTNLVQNLGGDTGSGLRPGTRALRQAYVKQASLGSDGSAALAVAAEEDAATDADRAAAGAGNSFVPPALCADFGSTPTKQPVAAATAQVTCDLGKERTGALASYTSDEGVLLTTHGERAPAPAPVQVGSSSASAVVERLAPRGALRTRLTATAENITILGLVKVGRVTSTVGVSTNGRRGSAVAAAPSVTVSGVEANGAPVCAASCSTAEVEAALNKALEGRARVEFPTAMVQRSPGGTSVGVRQDPWYHAERVLDYDKADDDYAVPAMTIVVYLDRAAKSRLVVDLAGVSTDASYRIFALDKFTGDSPTAPGPVGAVLVPSRLGAGDVAVPAGAPRGAGSPAAIAAEGGAQGLLDNVANALRLGLRSPAAAVPLLLIWALLAMPEYLAARRRLLLELPMLTREQDVT